MTWIQLFFFGGPRAAALEMELNLVRSRFARETMMLWNSERSHVFRVNGCDTNWIPFFSLRKKTRGEISSDLGRTWDTTFFFLHRQAWDWNFLRCLQVGASTTTWPKKNPKKTLLGAKQLIKRHKRRNSSSLSLSHRLSSKKAWKKPPTKTTFFGNARDSLGSNLCPYLPNGCVITYLSHQGVTCTPNWSKAGRNSHVCSEI